MDGEVQTEGTNANDPRSAPTPLEEARSRVERNRMRCLERGRQKREDVDSPSWHFRIPEKLLETVIRLARHVDYKNFHWAVVWDVLLKCNLQCVYCTRIEDSHNQDGILPPQADPAKIVEEIIRLRPKLLLVTGGEPALLPELPEYLRRIKAEGGDPFIVLNTNLMIPAQSIGAVLPHADGFNVSIDSLGKGNILNRGVDGEKLFSRLEELWRTVETLDRTVLVTVFSVVTLHNYREIPEMIERIHRLSPKISVVITAMQPFEHPLSITSHADLLGPFLQSLQEMQKGRKELIIEIPNVVMNRANSGRELKVKSHIKCIRQYFRTEIPVLGENAYCKPTRFTHLFRQQAKEARAQRNSVRMWQIAYRAARSLLMPPHTTRCYFPCKCEMPIERIVRSRHANDPILNFLLFRGRFTDEDIKTATRFIHRFNPFFRASFLKQFRRDNASERSNRITPE